MKTALILWGGWKGHEPSLTSKRFAGLLEKNGYEVTLSDTLDVLADLDALMKLDLIVTCWTMGTIPNEYVNNVCKAVGAGVGLAGCHGGMCDAFRESTRWQFMTGGQWVAHPGGDGIHYTVNICKGSSPLVEGLDDFEAPSITTCMWTLPLRFWQPPVSPSFLIIIFLTSLWTCLSPGPSSGDWAGYSICRSDITTMSLTRLPQRRF